MCIIVRLLAKFKGRRKSLKSGVGKCVADGYRSNYKEKPSGFELAGF